MKKTLFLAAILAMGATAFAQTDEQKSTMCSNGNDAVTNHSLYIELAQQKKPESYLAAYEFWRPLYDAVPNFDRNLYIHGENVMLAKINSLKDNPEERAKLVEDLLNLYENRIKNGFTSATGAGSPAALKAKRVNMYLKLNGKNADQQKAYQDLDAVMKEFNGEVEPFYIEMWCNLSLANYKADATKKNAYLDDYMRSSEYVDKALDRYYPRLEKDTLAVAAGTADAKTQKDVNIVTKLIKDCRDSKIRMTQNFANSGVADVQTLVDIFTPQVEEKKTDLAFLNNVSKLLGRSKEGRETDLYTHVADYSYQIEPSMEAAKGLAQAALKAKDYERSLQYYNEALDRAIQPDDKCEILLYEAAIYQEQGKKSNARECLRKSLSLDPEQATPHVMIANLYATSANQCGEEKPALKSLVYVAAYQEMLQAAAKASTDEEKAKYQRAAAGYKAGFPEKGALFMQAGKQPGDSHTIGGWMGVTVTIQCQ